MKDNNYYVIQGWMVNQLNLKGNDLLLFAIIYGFSQDNESEFTGSLNYLCKSMNCSRNTAKKALLSLADKGLIKKIVEVKNNIVFNKYSVIDGGGQKLTKGGSVSDKEGGQFLTEGGSVSDPNITINNNNINNTNINKRIKDFEKSLIPYLDKYKKQMLREFADYWCEHSPGDKKLNWENQKVFGLKRRLATWHNSKFNNYKNPIKSDEVDLIEITQNMLNKVRRDV